jgi:hypothetical protein
MVLMGMEAEYVSKDEVVAFGKIMTFVQQMEILHIHSFGY